MTLTTIQEELYALLNASSASDLVFWSAAEFSGWMEEAAHRMATAGVFAVHAAFDVTALSAGYTLPERHVSAVTVFLANATLRPMNIQELDALSSDWRTETGTPTRYALDGESELLLYKNPTAPAAGAMVYFTFPTYLVSTETAASAPVCDYFKYSVLAEARQVSGEAAMPEVADASRGRMAIFEQTFTKYYGATV